MDSHPDEVNLRRHAQRACDRLVEANAGAHERPRAFEDVVGVFCLGQSHAAHGVHRTLHEGDYCPSRLRE
jgi:hypothetical protein